jgi:hypothetical protein
MAKGNGYLSSEWVGTRQLCEAIGCSRDHIATLRKWKVLKHKKHWKNINPSAARPTYRYHLKRCMAALDELEA